MDLKKLSKKFPEQDLEWRIQQCGNNSWALVVPYITNRAIMQRLDEACGIGGWKNEFKASPCNTGYLCGISIKADNEWITRWDGSEVTGGGNIDRVKSTLSTSMKRTGVQWGIGRYLYQFDTGFATVKPVDTRKQTDVANGFIYHENKKKKEKFQWRPPAVPNWALPVCAKEVKANVDAILNADNPQELRMLYENAYKLAISEEDDQMMDKFVQAKNQAKEAFVAADKANELQNQEVTKKTVTEQIEILNSATNVSALDGLTTAALNQIQTITRGDMLKTAIGTIKKASYAKAKQLREGE